MLLALLAHAADPELYRIVEAAGREQRRSLCSTVVSGPGCEPSELAEQEENLRVACAGLARLWVERTEPPTVFSAAKGTLVWMADPRYFLPQRCGGHPELMDGLAARVHHDNVWSVSAFAEIASKVPGHEGDACAAWAEVVRLDPEAIVGTRTYQRWVGTVARCGDDGTIRAAFGPEGVESAMGSAFLGLAYESTKRAADACAAYKAGYRVGPQESIDGDPHFTVSGLRRACGQEDAVAFIGATARFNAAQPGRPAEDRLEYAGDADVDAPSETGIEAGCRAIADALVTVPVFTEPPYDFLIEKCTPEWRVDTAARLEAVAKDASPSDAAGFRSLAVWVMKRKGR